MELFECPFLDRPVELTDERERHIEHFHPQLLPDHRNELAETLRGPDFVGTRDGRSELALVRFWPQILGGKSIVAVVLTGPERSGGTMRSWLVTAYFARSTNTWRRIWTRS